MDTIGKGHYGHINKGGMFLDQKVPNEKFRYDLEQIEWIDDVTKNRLFDLVSSNVKMYGNLNPYAFVIGSLATVIENDKYVITKDSLKKSFKLLDNTNYNGEKISELIEKADIIRYARLYIRLLNTFGESQITDIEYTGDDMDDDMMGYYEQEDDYDEEDYMEY